MGAHSSQGAKAAGVMCQQLAFGYRGEALLLGSSCWEQAAQGSASLQVLKTREVWHVPVRLSGHGGTQWKAGFHDPGGPF